jgi:uncharacterized protein DUF3592
MSFVTSLLAGVMAPTGAALVWRAARGALRSRVAPDWPRVWGVVTTSRVREVAGDECAEYLADIGYEYEVAGVVYSSNAIRVGEAERYQVHSQAEARAAHYRVGRRILVWYDPRAPHESLLEPHDRDGLYAWGLAGAGLIAASIWLLF